MIIAYTRIDKEQDVLIKEINNEFIVEYRIDLFPVAFESFKTFLGAEKFYSRWVQSLFKQRREQ